MIDSKYRTPYQTFVLGPLLRIKWVQRLSPSSLTLAGLGLGLVSAFFMAFGLPFLAISTLLCSGVCDTLDGSIARLQNRASSQGAVLDIFSDRVVELAIILGLYFFSPEERGLLCLLMLGSILLCITSFLVVGIFTQNASYKSFHYSPGLMERTEAFIFFGALSVLPGHFTLIATLFSLLVAWTGLKRIIDFLNSAVYE